MSKYYNNLNNLPFHKNWRNESIFGKARDRQLITSGIDNHFNQDVLYYLNEQIINHLFDSLILDSLMRDNFKDQFNDFSFFTAPAYKAFEGFLFQIAQDLNLPSSGNPKFVGTYFDEEKVDKAIDKLLKELEIKVEKESRLSKNEKIYIKDMVKEMNRFLHHYRHTPAHFHGEVIDTIDKARQNILSMYRIINETIKTLLNSKLVNINEDIH